MRRRDFITLIGGAVFAWPRAAMAQDSVKHPLVGILAVSSSTTASHYISALRHGLQQLGYVEGKDIYFAYRYAEGD